MGTNRGSSYGSIIDATLPESFQKTQSDIDINAIKESENVPLLNQSQISYNTTPQPLTQSTNPDSHFKKKLIVKIIAAVIASLHASNLGFNGLGADTGTPTKNYSLDWFENLSLSEQTDAVMSALSAFSVNAIMFTRINLKAVENILKGLKENKLMSGLFGFLSAYGGFPLFAIAVAGYMWAPPFVGHFFGILSYLNTATSRFTGLFDLAHSIQDLFNIDVKLQKKAIDKLQHIKNNPQLQQEINTFLQDKPLNHDTFLSLMEFLDQKGDEKTFDKKTTQEQIKETVAMSADIAIGFSIALIGFVIYTQKTVDGLIDFEELFRNEAFISEWSKAAQFALGLPGGVLSAIFYGKNAAQIRETIFKTISIMIDALRYFGEHKLQSAGTLTVETGLGVLNYYGRAALKSISQGVVNNPNNIYAGILLPATHENTPPTAYAWLNNTITHFQSGLKAWLPNLGGFAAMTINSANSFPVLNHYLSPPPPEGKMTPSVEEVIAFEKANPLRDKSYKGQLSRLSIFANTAITPPSLLPTPGIDDRYKKMSMA